MKKIIICLMFLVISSISYAGIYGKAEIGKPVGYSYYSTENSEKQDYSGTYFTDIQLGYKNYFFNVIEYRIYAGIYTWAETPVYKGEPFETIYGVGSRLSYRGFFIRYNHFCAHPVSSTKYDNQYIADNKSWMSSLSTISCGIEFEIK